MTTISVPEKVLVKYLREKPTYKTSVKFDENGFPYPVLEIVKGKVIGCIVATDKNVIGWSLVNAVDRPWNGRSNKYWGFHDLSSKRQMEEINNIKKRSFDIAYNRSIENESLDEKEREAKYFKVPFSIEQEAADMLIRSQKYFK